MLGLIILLFFPVQTKAESASDSLNQMIQELQKNPDNGALREKIVKAAQGMDPAPTIPEEARQHFIEGTTIAKSASNASGQKLAVESYQEALKIAPWWGDAYYNMSVAQDLAGQFDAAQASLRFYILTNPGNKETRDAQDKIYALNAKKKLAAHMQSEKQPQTATENPGMAPVPRATTKSEPISNMRCKSPKGVIVNLAIDTAERTIREQWNTPCQGCEGHMIIDGYLVGPTVKFPDPSNQTLFSMQVSDETIVWSETYPSLAAYPFPTNYKLDRFAGNLRQTRQAFGIYREGWDVTYVCEKRSKF